MKFIPLLFLVVMLNFSLKSQDYSLSHLTSVFENFEYSEAILLADSILQDKNITPALKNEVLLIKAISHYSLSQEVQSRKCFIEMMKNDPNLQLDSNTVAPKILSLFLSVKEEFNDLFTKGSETNENLIDRSKLSDAEISSLISRYDNYSAAIYKSILIPGWGHYSIEQKTKGLLIEAASLLNLGGIVYFTLLTREKERSYLGSIDPVQIQIDYVSFNKAYKTRNYLIASYIGIWLYTQIDLLLFDHTENVLNTFDVRAESYYGQTGYFIEFKFPIF